MYQWNPEWERVRIKIGDREITLCRDKVTGMYVCPRCTDPDKLCPEGQKTRSIIPEETTYLLTEIDVLNHLRECEKGVKSWGYAPKYEDEEEEEEEEEL
ncbi:MAG TPA: hypothetical protein VNL13_08270 [Sulfolobales archaeon]|nr:hypothetical protein [Sulfolobales archaeon]